MEHCEEQPCSECENEELCDKYDNKTLSKTYKEAADAIEELSKDRDNWKATAKEEREAYWHWFDQYQKDVPRWIPVTERLLEMTDGENISKEVYVTDGVNIAQACIIRDYDGVTSWSYTGIGEITHWCEQIPLPQPPKEENS